jgi:hypothetical protein
MSLLKRNSNNGRQETRRERRSRLKGRRPTVERPYVSVSPFWGICTAFHLWEQIFFSSPVAHFDWSKLLEELDEYDFRRYLRMNGRK